QEAKLELVCTKLGLSAGERVLDVGCGWGSFALHAAGRHGVHVTGITLSPAQAALARARAEEAGLADRIDIRLVDYRELAAEPFDAISSIGMVEHVGESQIDAYAARLAELLKPGGRLLNHGIARQRHTDPDAGAAGAGARRLRDAARRGLRRRLRRDAAALGAAARRAPGRGDATGRRG